MTRCDYPVINNEDDLVHCGAQAATVVFGADWYECVCLTHAVAVRQETLTYGPYAGWDTA